MEQTSLSPSHLSGLRQAFKGLSEEEILLFVHSGEVVCLQSGQMLFNRGDDARALFFILSGQLSVIKESGIGRKEQIVALLQPYAPVGEGIAAGQRKHGASVKALEETLLLKIENTTFENLTIEHQGAVTKLLKHLLNAASKRLEKCSDRLAHIL